MYLVSLGMKISSYSLANIVCCYLEDTEPPARQVDVILSANSYLEVRLQELLEPLLQRSYQYVSQDCLPPSPAPSTYRTFCRPTLTTSSATRAPSQPQSATKWWCGRSSRKLSAYQRSRCVSVHVCIWITWGRYKISSLLSRLEKKYYFRKVFKIPTS